MILWIWNTTCVPLSVHLKFIYTWALSIRCSQCTFFFSTHSTFTHWFATFWLITVVATRNATREPFKYYLIWSFSMQEFLTNSYYACVRSHYAIPFDIGCMGSDASCARSSTLEWNKSKHAEKYIDREREKRCSTSPSTFNKFMLYTFCERGIHFSSLECFQFFRCFRDRTFSAALTKSTHTHQHTHMPSIFTKHTGLNLLLCTRWTPEYFWTLSKCTLFGSECLIHIS